MKRVLGQLFERWASICCPGSGPGNRPARGHIPPELVASLAAGKAGGIVEISTVYLTRHNNSSPRDIEIVIDFDHRRFVEQMAQEALPIGPPDRPSSGRKHSNPNFLRGETASYLSGQIAHDHPHILVF